MKVELKNIRKVYGKTVVIPSMDLTIEEGALHFFLGPSGCGKTTTLRMLAGLEEPTGGKLIFDGQDVTKTPAAERGIAMVFQNYALWPHMTVRKNIEYGLVLQKLSKAEIKKQVDNVLDFTQLHEYGTRSPGQLSGGQQQRVALARALAVKPKLLLLDEPLSNLDAKLRLEMRENITRIHRETGLTMVYVTHDQKEALSMGTAVSVMESGHVVQTADPKHLYHNPVNSFIAGFIGETNLLTFEKSGELVKTELGDMKTSREMGSAKVLSIRPEAIKVDFTGVGVSSELMSFRLKLLHSIYLGESEQYFFETSVGQIKAQASNVPIHNLKDGDMVGVGIHADDLVPLPH